MRTRVKKQGKAAYYIRGYSRILCPLHTSFKRRMLQLERKLSRGQLAAIEERAAYYVHHFAANLFRELYGCSSATPQNA